MPTNLNIQSMATLSVGKRSAERLVHLTTKTEDGFVHRHVNSVAFSERIEE